MPHPVQGSDSQLSGKTWVSSCVARALILSRRILKPSRQMVGSAPHRNGVTFCGVMEALWRPDDYLLGGKTFPLEQKELAMSRPKSGRRSLAADHLLKEETAGPCLDLRVSILVPRDWQC